VNHPHPLKLETPFVSQRYKNPPVNLTDFKAKKAEEGAVRIKAGTKTFLVMPPELMGDDQYLEFIKLEGTPESIVDQAHMLMGDRYDEFVEAGGSAILLLSIIAEAGEVRAETQGVDPGGSGASSRS
jgi:hypothetical protein